MKNISIRRGLLVSVLSMALIAGVIHPVPAVAASTTPIILLSQYQASLSIGEEFYLVAVASNGKMPTFKSSSSRIASVNSYGRVTAKQAGTCRITAKVSSGTASCTVKVKKTQITVDTKKISMENGENYRLRVSTSNKSEPTFSSNRKSVVIVDSEGVLTACKPGEAVITIKADQTTVNCQVTVKKPTIKLSKSSANLFRCQQLQLEAQVSSGLTPVWKSNRTRVATVSDTGLVVARAHGTALISAKVDGVTKICEITVRQPTIKLSANTLTMKVGEKKQLSYTVSSGNAPVIKSSKPNVVKVDQKGNLTAKAAGTSVISFSEDGVRETCSVRVVK